MKPTIVHVHYSEAGGALAEGAILDFKVFEVEALKAALGHTSGGYLKTKITVHFDNGHTYEGRFDLGAYEPNERGFEHGIKQRIEYHESPEGQRRLDEMHRALSEAQDYLYEVWCSIDFSADMSWSAWEIAGLATPVDPSFCTRTTRH